LNFAHGEDWEGQWNDDSYSRKSPSTCYLSKVENIQAKTGKFSLFIQSFIA